MRFPIGCRSVVWRYGAMALVLTMCFLPDVRSSTSGGFARCPAIGRRIEQDLESEATAGVRIAEGEYKVLTENGIGPTDPAVYGFRESWTLWRLQDGSFEVKGTRSYRSPSYEPQSDDFSVHLSSALTVLALKEYRKLRWRPDSGPLSCEFLLGKISCTSNAKNASQNVRLDVPVESTAGLLWPIPAFSLSSVARSANRTLKVATPVEFVQLKEASVANPVYAIILTGQLTYLGHEQLSLADRRWEADKFELEVATHPPYYLWTSPEGLLLSFSLESKNKAFSDERMVLVRFQQWEKF